MLSAWVATIAPLTHSHVRESDSHVCLTERDLGHADAHTHADLEHDHDAPAPFHDDCPLCALLAILPNTWVMPSEGPSLTPIEPGSFVTPDSRPWTSSLEPTLPRPRGPPWL
mgnify:FL=1